MEKMEKVVKLNYENFGVTLTLNLSSGKFYETISNEDVVKYLKGIFSNKSRFKSRFIDKFLNANNTLQKLIDDGETTEFDHITPGMFECEEICNKLLDIYDMVEPFSYGEAFKIEEDEFRALVFGSIDVNEMIENLGHERIKTEGKRVKHKKFSDSGEFLGMEEYDVIYETHEINCQDLGLNEKAYALKCWCTSTNKEHWLWIEDEFKDSPLEAVASTFRVHANVLPHIKEIKRQGDVLLVEMKKEVIPEGEIITLNADQYFDLLTIQT